MDSKFHIDCINSAGNLHVTLQGEFNGKCAWKLFTVLKRRGYSGRVFVNTKDIRKTKDDVSNKENMEAMINKKSGKLNILNLKKQ